jgi:hypothetical protein
MAATLDAGRLALIHTILARTGSDPALRSQIVAGGAKTLRALGVGIPEGVTVTILEDSATVRHFVIPRRLPAPS